MGAVGVATGESRGCAPKTFRMGSVDLCMEDDRTLDDRGVKSVDEGVGESLPGWRDSQAPMMMQKTDDAEEKGALILGLPDDAMTLVFARLPRQSLAMTRLVCSSWKRVAERQELASLRLMMGTSEGWIYVLAQTPKGTPFRAYDPIAGKWSILPPIPGRSEDQQWQGFACVGFRHKLFLIGGTRKLNSPNSEGMVCSNVVIYDSLTNKWTKGANMNTSRSWAAAAVVGDKLYVAGGQGTTKFLDSAEVYDPHTDTWKIISSMGVVRSSCQGVALDGQFWVIAGEYVKNHYDDNQKSSAEVYDADTNTWRFVPNMCLDDNKLIYNWRNSRVLTAPPSIPHPDQLCGDL
uniref:F-box domain-containing protein n=2 Tax=Physcomitrium patens TaxID=3218 RepID=A0A7I4F9I2_PHYPA